MPAAAIPLQVILGTALVIRTEFRVPASAIGTPTDPDLVTISIKLPDDSIESFDNDTSLVPLVHDSPGVFSIVYLPASVGHYVGSSKGVGTVDATANFEFWVLRAEA